MIKGKQLQLWNVRNVTVTDSPVTAASGDWIHANTAGGDVQVNGPEIGTWGASKASSGDANNVNVSCTGGGTIAGAATQSFNAPFASMTLVGNGAGADIQSFFAGT
jgi:hypothetical protein